MVVDGGGNAPGASLIGGSGALELVRRCIERFGPEDTLPVLVVGESGCGKELVAHELQRQSPRRERPFIRINCGGLEPGLLASELFGHMRGAFTGATSDKAGAFELADGATLFLDELAELPLAQQPMLLRVLQEGEVKRVGAPANKVRKVDVRVIAATNANLEERVRQGTFRADLYYRLAVLTIRVPPLHERPEDIPALVDQVLAPRRLSWTSAFSHDAQDALLNYPWPGNVRQLFNVVQRAAVIVGGRVITVADLAFAVPTVSSMGTIAPTLAHQLGRRGPKPRAVDAETFELHLRELRSVDEAARRVGISRTTAYRRFPGIIERVRRETRD